MPRLINADRLKIHYEWWASTEEGKERKELFDSIIEAQPLVDAEPVVRCKDCFLCEKLKNGRLRCEATLVRVYEDDFCSHGSKTPVEDEEEDDDE